MIDVSVSEHDGMDRCGKDRQRCPVSKAQLLKSLEQPAIDQNMPLRPRNQVLRPRHRASGAPKT